MANVLEESIAVEYIPSVVKGETREEAARRVRSIFVSINSYAKKTDKGEGYLLDESDGYSIAARKVGLKHPLFEKERAGSRVNWKNTGLPKRSCFLTTLQALRDMLVAITEETAPNRAEDWAPKFKGAVPLRPTEIEIDAAAGDLLNVLDQAMALPSLKAIVSGDALDTWRDFPDPDDQEDDSKGHLLLRPIGQVIFVRAIGRLMANGMDLHQIFSKLVKFDAAGGFEAHDPMNVWFEVTYSQSGKMIMGKTDLATRLLTYLVEGADSDTQAELLDEVKELRQSSQDNSKWLNFDGEWVSKSDPSAGLVLPIM